MRIIPSVLAAALIGALVGATGCETVSTAAPKTVRKATQAAADVLVPVSEENKLGEELSAQVRQELTIHPDDQVQQYVDMLGRKVVRAAGDAVPEGIEFTFTVVKDDDTINAFAMPGGHIYIYSGLMKLAQNEAQLVSVLAHEVAHVTKRHVAQRLVQAYGYQTVIGLALGEDPGALAQIAGNVATQGALLKHSRDHEWIADVNGLSYMIDAGYDPHAFVEMFQLMAQAGGARPPLFLSSHPYPEQRVEHAKTLLQNRRDVPDALHRARYEDVLMRL